MKLANGNGRAVLVVGDEIADIAETSDGRFGPQPMSLYDDWAGFVDFAQGVTSGTAPLIQSDLRCPVPAPRQVFAIGLNYRTHAEETGMAAPEAPATFTKFPTSLAGPFDDVEMVGDQVDWEVELVAVVGRRADRVDEPDGWDHIAGLTVGQDISDRHLQFAAGRTVLSREVPARAMDRWVRGSSPRTQYRTPTTSAWGVRWMVRWSRTPAPAT